MKRSYKTITLYPPLHYWYPLTWNTSVFIYLTIEFHWPQIYSINIFSFKSRVVQCKSKKVKLSPFSRGRPEASLFNSYYTELQGRALLLSLDCSTLPSTCPLYCWVLSKEVSSTIFKVLGMMWPGIEPRSPESLMNALPTRPMSR